MTYNGITKKLAHLEMTPSDWAWLDGYCHATNSSRYDAIVKAYQARESNKQPACNIHSGACRYCGNSFKCGYAGFCSNQC